MEQLILDRFPGGRPITGVLFGLFSGLLLAAGAAADPSVTASSPADQQLGVALSARITIEFASPMDPSTVVDGNVLVTSSLRGRLSGNVSWFAPRQEIRFTPAAPFVAGERIEVTLGKGLRDFQGDFLANGHHFQFSPMTLAVPGASFTTSPGSWDIGSIALNLTVTDLDGDGLPEAVFSNVVPDSLTILTSNGAGGFSEFAIVPTLIQPRHVAAGDVDGDGLTDLVSCASGPDLVEVFRNLGGGVFAPGVSYAVGQTPYGAYLGDLDADGDLDLAVANFNSDDLAILENTGGVFAPAVMVSSGAGADSPRWVDGADLDGDGDIDLASCNGNSSDISIFRNDGSGGFTLQPIRPVTGGSPNFLEASDLDGDAVVDLVTVNALGESITVVKGVGDGTFLPPGDYDVLGALPAGMHVVDVDGDQDLDVLVPIRGPSEWRAMHNDGTGVFTPGPGFGGGAQCHSVGSADWDGDGDVDVISGFAQSRLMRFFPQLVLPAIVSTVPEANVTGAAPDGKIELFMNTPLDTGTIGPGAFRVVGSQSGRKSLQVQWFASQKKIRLTPATDFLPGETVTVTVVHGALAIPDGPVLAGRAWAFTVAGEPTSAVFDPHEVALTGLDPTTIDATDLDGDGTSDLAVGNFLSAEVTVLLASPGRTPAVTGSFAVAAGPIDLVSADLDGNGHMDLAVASLIDPSVSILFNSGGATFAPHVTVASPALPTAIAAADLDLDGDPDLVTTESSPESIRVLWNDGTGAFPTSSTIVTSGFLVDLAVADLDGNGKLEVVACDGGENELEIFSVAPDAPLAAAGTIALEASPSAVYAWDTNGDGRIDLVTSDFQAASLTIRENLGDGTFGPGISLPVGALPSAVWGADITGDGAIDLLSVDGGQNEVTLFRSLGNGGFGAGQQIPVGVSPASITAGDWDGDGKIDLAIVNRTGRSVTVLTNGGPTSAPPLASTPGGPRLEACPNPFSGATTVELDLATGGEIELRVYDLRGRLVGRIFEGSLPGGRHRVPWAAQDGLGRALPSGVYFLRLSGRGGPGGDLRGAGAPTEGGADWTRTEKILNLR